MGTLADTFNNTGSGFSLNPISDASAATDTSNGADTSTDPVPEWLKAADLHNLGNGNPSMNGSPDEINLDYTTKFVRATIKSGINELYNTAQTVGSWLGADTKQRTTEEYLRETDSNLVDFYLQHQDTVDLLGFALSSFVPGTGGIKLLNAGEKVASVAVKTGKVGGTLGKALGLLSPTQDGLVLKAVADITSSKSTFNALRGSTLKALGSGFTRNTLEAAAFETAVAATMYKSPVLTNMDATDMFWNMAIGAGLGGVIGGSLSGFSTWGKIKRGVSAVEDQISPWKVIYEGSDKAVPSDRAAMLIWGKSRMPEVPLKTGVPEHDMLVDKIIQTKNQTVKTYDTRLRAVLQDFAKGDEYVGQTLFENLKNMPHEDAINILVQAKETGKLATDLLTEKEIAKLGKKVLDMTDTETEAFANKSVRYLKMHGTDAGSILDTAPTTFNLADTLPKGKTIELHGNKVVAGNRSYQFAWNKDWNIFSSDHLETEARYIWAEKSAPLPTGAVLSEDDLPLLYKAYKEGNTSVNVKMLDGSEKAYDATSKDFADFLIFKKHDVAYRLQNTASVPHTATEVEKILKQELKLDFSVVDSNDFIAAHASAIDANLLNQFASKSGALKQILVSRKALTDYPLKRLMQSIKHEQGHSFFQPIVDIGGIDVNMIPALRNELIPVSKRARPDMWKDVKLGDTRDYLLNSMRDPNTLSSLHELMADAYSYASQHPEEMKKLAPTWWHMFGESVHPVPQKFLDSLITRNINLTQEQIAKMVDVNPSVLTGELTQDTSTYFARQKARTDYTKRLIDSGARPADAAGEIDLDNVPSIIKMSYDRTPVMDVNGNALEGMAIVMQKQRLYQDAIDRVFASYIPPEFSDKFVPYTMEDLFEAQVSKAPGRTFLGASNSNYGTFANKTELNGQIAVRARIKAGESVKDTYAPVAYKLANNPEAAIEWSVLTQNVRNVPDQYVLDITEATDTTERSGRLVLKKIRDYNQKVQEAINAGADPSKIKLPEIADDIPKEFPIKNADTLNFVETYSQQNARRRTAHNALQSVRDGISENADPSVFYPPSPNPKHYRHFAFVVDRSVTGFERSKMLYAQDEEQLARLISLVEKDKPASWEVLTKKDAESWYKAIGQFEYEKSIKDVAFDSALKRKGVSANVIVPTDPAKIVNDFMDYEVQREHNLVNELISAKYQPQFEALKQMGDTYTSIATSKKGSLQSLLSYAEEAVKNPYADYIKSTLGLPRNSEYAWWFSPQKLIDTKISQLYHNIGSMFSDAKSTDDLLKINDMLKKYGYKGPNYDEAINAWANYSAPKNVLANFTAKANAILANLTLRLDFLNAANNTIGSHVLYYPELRSIIRAIEKGDTEAVGKLTGLAKVKLPGDSANILSPTKLHAKAISNYFSALKNEPNAAELLQTYRDYGVLTHITDQYKYVIDELTLTGLEDAAKLNTKIESANNFLVQLANKGERLTGNRLAEEYNRFIAADSARQIMQIAVDKGIISKSEMWANINTFVNRTQGNYVSAFRPAVLQGPVGQAVGLFQTYQLNLLQQLFRHVAEGDMKDAMLMMGLQGTIYGLNGLPAFNAINTHILGTMGGNPEHKDVYYHAYNAAGKEAADWLMYGAASNVLGMINKDLRTNLYVRGDINPRQVTVLPTSVADIPIVNAWTKVIGGLKNAITNIVNGGDVWNSMLTGIEHASVNRPLAGLAQILQATDNPESLVFSTTNQGNIIASNDLLSLANLSRLAGGKPFDQAIVQDLGYRMQVYASNTTAKKDSLSRAIKSSMYKGKEPSEEQIARFGREYVNIGGDQKTWNQFWVRQITNANIEQGDRIAKTLKTPALQKLQVLMGGDSGYAEDNSELTKLTEENNSEQQQ